MFKHVPTLRRRRLGFRTFIPRGFAVAAPAF
jgi:hypothetical protein